jgi:glutathione S-transferase
MAMYTLYNVKGMGSMTIQFLLDELEVPYVNNWMSIEQVRTSEFRKVSPLGFVPALGLQDGRTLFETAGIITFLVTAHSDSGLSPRPGSHGFGEFLSWLELIHSNLYRALNMAFHGEFYAMTPAHNEFITNKAIERCNGIWEILDRRLAANGPWLMGKPYSAIDIYAFVAATWGRPNEMAVLDKFRHVAKLAMAVRARPKLKAALEAHSVLKPGDYSA